MRYHQLVYAETLDRLVAPGCRWLDLGAGDRIHGGWGGVSQRDLAARAACLIGCDVVEDQLKANPYLTEYRVCRGEALPFPAGSFDLVSCNMVLEHLTDPVTVFTEAARVLVPGGVLVAMTPHRNHPIVFLASILLHPRWRSWLVRLSDKRSSEYVFPTVYRANTPKQVATIAAQSGLSVTTAEPFQSLPFAKGWLAKVEASFGWKNNLLVVLTKAPSPVSRHPSTCTAKPGPVHP
jgi:ubiquinone/menaquinone biosynthesis C-methylase UbiE